MVKIIRKEDLEKDLKDTYIISQSNIELLSKKVSNIRIPLWEFNRNINELIESDSEDDIKRAEDLINTQLNGYFHIVKPIRKDDHTDWIFIEGGDFTVLDTINLLAELLHKHPSEIAYYTYMNHMNLSTYFYLNEDKCLSNKSKVENFLNKCSNQDILTALAK